MGKNPYQIYDDKAPARPAQVMSDLAPDFADKPLSRTADTTESQKKGCCGCGSCFSVLLVLVVVIVGFSLWGLYELKNTVPISEALKRANNNSTIIQQLGQPLEASTFFHGSIKYINNHAEAHLEVPISGPYGEATLFIRGTKNGDGDDDTWTYQQMECVINATEQHIDLHTQSP